MSEDYIAVPDKLARRMERFLRFSRHGDDPNEAEYLRTALADCLRVNEHTDKELGRDL